MIEKRHGTERRTKKIDYRRRKVKRRSHIFYYERTIYLTDTNAYKNVYFAQYFDFMGEAREALLSYLIRKNPEEFFRSNIALITVDTSAKYKSGLYLFDQIRIEVTVEKLTRVKIYLNFKIIHAITNVESATGKMTLSAALDGKIIRIPPVLTEGLQAFFKE